MKALIYQGPRQVAVEDIPECEHLDGTVRLAVKYCGICGSDMGIYLGTHPRAKAPLVLGHEFLGVVLEDGKNFKKGDRVVPFPLLSCGHCRACRTGNSHVCNSLGLIGIDRDGGVCERICVDEDVLYKVPEEVSDKAAVVIEPLAVIVRAVHQSGFQAMDTCVVVGAGPIGMLTGIVLKAVGADKVFISDISPKRLEQAKPFGLIPVNPEEEDLEKTVKEATDGEGCDVLFECSGASSAALQMTGITRVSGNICLVAVHKAPHEMDLRELNFKEQHLVGSRVYTREEFREAVRLSARLEKQLEAVVTHIVPIRESAKVFDMMANPECGTIKVVVDCRPKRRDTEKADSL